jgi:hypothetical protein
MVAACRFQCHHIPPAAGNRRRPAVPQPADGSAGQAVAGGAQLLDSHAVLPAVGAAAPLLLSDAGAPRDAGYHQAADAQVGVHGLQWSLTICNRPVESSLCGYMNCNQFSSSLMLRVNKAEAALRASGVPAPVIEEPSAPLAEGEKAVTNRGKKKAA